MRTNLHTATHSHTHTHRAAHRITQSQEEKKKVTRPDTGCSGEGEVPRKKLISVSIPVPFSSFSSHIMMTI